MVMSGLPSLLLSAFARLAWLMASCSAVELHDTLLQSFQSLLLRFQVVSELLADHPAVRAKLDAAIAQVAQAIVEGRDAIQNLRSSTTVGSELAQAMTALAEECWSGQARTRSR